MNILWSPEAIEDLNSLRAYIAQDNPSAARAVALHIAHSIEQLLSDNPQMGRPGRVPGTRELVIPKALHRALSTAAKCHSNFARLSRGAPLA